MAACASPALAARRSTRRAAARSPLAIKSSARLSDEAISLGTNQVKVAGVLSIGEHGQYGFTPEEVEDQVTRELSVLRFVDRRFRPAIQIEPVEIERYYRETLMPQLEKAGAPDPPLAEVAAQIRELLTQKILDEQLNNWLHTLRQQGKIQMR